MNAIYLLGQGAKPWFSPAWAFVCPGSGNTEEPSVLLLHVMLVSTLYGKEIPK